MNFAHTHARTHRIRRLEPKHDFFGYAHVFIADGHVKTHTDACTNTRVRAKVAWFLLTQARTRYLRYVLRCHSHTPPTARPISVKEQAFDVSAPTLFVLVRGK